MANQYRTYAPSVLIKVVIKVFFMMFYLVYVRTELEGECVKPLGRFWNRVENLTVSSLGCMNDWNPRGWETVFVQRHHMISPLSPFPPTMCSIRLKWNIEVPPVHQISICNFREIAGLLNSQPAFGDTLSSECREMKRRSYKKTDVRSPTNIVATFY